MGYLDSTYCLWPDEKLELANGIFLKKKYIFFKQKEVANSDDRKPCFSITVWKSCRRELIYRNSIKFLFRGLIG